jgi:hypothetical protein
MELITIEKSEYEKLLHDRNLLNALREAGVDNWEGYSIALKSLEHEEDSQH